MTTNDTPKTDALRLKMAQLGWPSDGEPVAMLMASHGELERELSDARAWSSRLADLADDMRAELSDAHQSLEFQMRLNREVIEREKRTHSELAAERALADRLAASLDVLLEYVETGEVADHSEAHTASRALAAWKEARRA